MTPEWRDYLGRVVRDAWIAWATRQPDPKPSWLVPYDDLSAADQEADRLIGDAVWAVAEIDAEARIAALEAAARALLTDADPARFLANDDAYDRWVHHRAILAALLEDA